MKYNKIALIGMPGCGKTKTTQIISDKLNIEFLDSDKLFRDRFYSIADFFKNEGEDKFRAEETKILAEVCRKKSFILSTGGGVILNPQNRKLLFDTDITTFYLNTSVAELEKRLLNDSTRPLLNNTSNKINTLNEILMCREKYYKLANFEILTDNKTVDKVANEIIEIVK